MKYTLLFSIIKDKKEIGKIFVKHCPDLNLCEELLNFGDEGYKFLEIAQAIYGTIDNIELLTTSENDSIPFYDDNVCVVSWKLAYK